MNRPPAHRGDLEALERMVGANGIGDAETAQASSAREPGPWAVRPIADRSRPRCGQGGVCRLPRRPQLTGNQIEFIDLIINTSPSTA